MLPSRSRRDPSSIPPVLPTLILLAAVALLSAGAARADVLVMKDGARVETEGPWQVKGRQVIFTDTQGRLSTLRLSDVDLEASEEATRQAALPPPPPPEAAPPPPPAEPVLVLTNESIEGPSPLDDVTEVADIRMSFEQMSLGYRLEVKINGQKIRRMDGDDADTFPLFHVNHPNRQRLIENLEEKYSDDEGRIRDHFCLVQGTNTLEIDYESVDRSEVTTLYLKLSVPSHRQPILEMRQAERRSGTLSTTFEVYEIMPADFETQRPKE